jgi:hypothetical protein
MTLNRAAAAYLAYFAYIDDALETVQPSDFETYLRQVPSGGANGPWTLVWGPSVNDGILAYIALGADGSHGLAFRGTDSDTSVTGAFQNFLVDLEAFNYVPWLYPQNRSPALQLSAGTNQALGLAIGMTDPATDTSLLDYLRSLAASKPLELIVAGHSLGGALTVAAAAWLYDQLPKAGAVSFSIWPHTFAAPTVWNDGFASWFSSTFSYYAAINTNDIVPMAWNNLNEILTTFPQPGPNLKDTDWLIYEAVILASGAVPSYTAIAPNDAFTVTPVSNETWLQEAGLMHSMEYQYFPHATDTAAPKLPNTSKIGVARPRAAAAR